MGPIENIEKPVNIGDEMIEILFYSGKRKFNYDENKKKKTDIISKIPNDFIDAIESRVKEEMVRYKKSGRKFNFEAIVSGEIFERLCLAEFPPESDLAFALLSMMQHPEKWNIPELSGKRNPDMTYIKMNEDTGKTEIISVGDAKAGDLGPHSFHQLNNGFKETLEELVSILNDPNEVRNYDLEKIKKRCGELEISKDFIQTIIVPFDRNIDYPSTLINEIYFRNNPSEMDDFCELLNDPTKVRVIKSSFSRNDLSLSTDFVVEKLKNRI